MDIEVSCERMRFKSDEEAFRFAAADNARHGRPLDTFDKKRISARLAQYGDSSKDIARVLGVPVARVETWLNMTVVVVGKQGRKTYRRREPIKHGLEHLVGEDVTEEQYQEHVERDRGVPAKNLAATLVRWLENGWVDMDDEKTAENMQALYVALSKVVHKEEVSA
jgi:hypothetical protein